MPDRITTAAFTLLLGLSGCAPAPPETPEEPTLRVALFNVWELSTGKLSDLDADGVGQDEQARAAATIIQRVRPDVLVINEIDHDYTALELGLELNARRFATAYLATGEAPIDYPYAWAAANNTGILSGVDLDGDGTVASEADRGEQVHGNDSFGFGLYPGQYSMAVLSRYPIDGDAVRSFRELLWRDLPGHHIPEGFYSEDALAVFRLSSKSHQDVPILVAGRPIHLLLSHPTPPVFDGEEDRNGRRNFDEIKLWTDYLDATAGLRDDSGAAASLASDEFVLVGDLNARPDASDSLYDGRTAISQLLEHPRIQDPAEVAVSAGAPTGLPAATTAFRGQGARIDYVLPGLGFEILDGGVFWPAAESDPVGAQLAERASDHHLVWLDLRRRPGP